MCVPAPRARRRRRRRCAISPPSHSPGHSFMLAGVLIAVPPSMTAFASAPLRMRWMALSSTTKVPRSTRWCGQRKVKGEPMHLIKVFGVFASTPQHPDEGCSPRELYDLLQDAVFRSEWDVYRQEAFRITLLQHNTDIGYYAAKSPAPMVANRDFVNQRMWHNAGRDEYVIFNTSVPHEAVPKHYQRDHNKGKYGKYVRATSKLTGYFIQPWRSPETGEVAGCSLTYITQTDPNGWIPTAVTNYISTKYAPNTIKNMRKAVLRFRTWLPAQMASGSYVKDWESEPKWWKEEGEVPSHTRDFAVRHWAGKKSAH